MNLLKKKLESLKKNGSQRKLAGKNIVPGQKTKN